MKKLFSSLGQRLRQPKWRHGKLSSLMMALLIVIVVLLNVAMQTIENAYGLRRDMSFNQYASTGEKTEKVLNELDTDVELYLLYQDGEENSQLLQVVQHYGVLSDRVKVLPTDISKNPGILTRFIGDMDSAVAAISVVVNCPATGRYVVLDYDDFYTQGYDIELGDFVVEGLSYEKKITEAILYTTQASVPTVGLLQGHGELTMEYMEVFVSFLEENQYDVREVVLLAGDTLEDVDVLLIADPVKDFGDTEIATISAFAQKGGSLFVIRDYTDPLDTMPNYLSLLRSYGVIPLPGIVVASQEDAGSYYSEPINLLPYMTDLDMTLPLTMSGMDILMLPVACAFETPVAPGEGDLSLSVGTVLKTGPNAYVRNITDGLDTAEKQPGDISGEISLALYAHRMHANGNVSRMFAIGNSTMFVEPFVYQRTYAEEFITVVMNELMPANNVSLDIMSSAAFRPALTVGSQGLGIALIVAMPLLCIALALIVLLPRRNR
ncbi:MAG: hypothetical protein E7319_00895 [Clostridiales bacterium]|nr:hypothetical protein [Clostridiales bacterium]